MPTLPSPHFARGGRYVPNHVSFGAMIASEQLRPALNKVTRLIALVAKVNTERSTGVSSDGEWTADDEAAETGEKSLADSYETERGPGLIVILGQDGSPGPRIFNRVVNRKRYAAAHEFGRGGHTKGKGSRDLRRAGETFGDLWGRGNG